MNRPGAILIPLLSGFLLTCAVVSWRSGWWEQHGAPASPALTPRRVEARPPHVRTVHLQLAADPWAPAAAARAAAAAAPPEATPEPVYAPSGPPPVPRVDPGDSPELLEAPARRFARGGVAGRD